MTLKDAQQQNAAKLTAHYITTWLQRQRTGAWEIVRTELKENQPAADGSGTMNKVVKQVMNGLRQ